MYRQMHRDTVNLPITLHRRVAPSCLVLEQSSSGSSAKCVNRFPLHYSNITRNKTHFSRAAILGHNQINGSTRINSVNSRCSDASAYNLPLKLKIYIYSSKLEVLLCFPCSYHSGCSHYSTPIHKYWVGKMISKQRAVAGVTARRLTSLPVSLPRLIMQRSWRRHKC